MKERRDSKRFNSALKAICQIGRRKKRSYKIKNISKSGALIVLDAPIDSGSEIKVSLDVPGDNIPIFISGKVAWQKKSILEPGSRKAYETGVKFYKFKRSGRSRFLDFIYAQ